ncbi:MAG: Nif3-like dinuclear metal center hexameric protein [Bacteroidales bacterium]|nr:Nif3-like dinuclear metal center hexameric protein [Bacteroidales bacterium]
MKLREIIAALERLAPLRLQDEWDNSGLQVGFPEAEVSKALVCLDVTEEIVKEAVDNGCNLIVSHHPLIFKALRQVSDATYQQRCVVHALASGISIYSAHTSLDNAPGGVNHRIAGKLGLQQLRWLCPKEGEDAGSGLVGELPAPERDTDFLARVQDTFGVECLLHSAPDGREIRRVALCGGAGAFLMRDAVRAGADCFLSGEFHYHDYFENQGVLLAELGHYQSEQFTQDLLLEYLTASCPGLRVCKTALNTNPIRYATRLPER